MKFLLIFLIAICGVCGKMEKYDGYKVYRVYANTEDEKNLLANLQKSPDLDFWTEINHVGLPVDVLVKPQDQKKFMNHLIKNGIQPNVYIEDVQKLINAERIGTYAKGSSRDMTWTDYYNLNDIYTWLDDVAVQNPDKASVVLGGTSFESRQIKGLKISFGSGKKAVIIEGGMHGREWIAPATATYLINQLLTNTDASFRKMAESFDWHIFPVVNPDGYSYTFTNDRLWRKTRRPYVICTGADANRNWNANWTAGMLNIPCTETYAGPRPFSETETLTFSSYISSIASNMVAYISFHSYSQLMMLPYGHTSDRLDNYNEMIQILEKAGEALYQKHGKRYEYGNIVELVLIAPGSSIDWVKKEFATPIVVSYEMRDTGSFGFLLPSNQIVPNGEEVVESLVAMMVEAEKFGYVTLG